MRRCRAARLCGAEQPLQIPGDRLARLCAAAHRRIRTARGRSTDTAAPPVPIAASVDFDAQPMPVRTRARVSAPFAPRSTITRSPDDRQRVPSSSRAARCSGTRTRAHASSSTEYGRTGHAPAATNALASSEAERRQHPENPPAVACGQATVVPARDHAELGFGGKRRKGDARHRSKRGNLRRHACCRSRKMLARFATRRAIGR